MRIQPQLISIYCFALVAASATAVIPPRNARAQDSTCSEIIGDFAGQNDVQLTGCVAETEQLSYPPAIEIELSLRTAADDLIDSWTIEVSISHPDAWEEHYLETPQFSVIAFPAGDDALLVRLKSNYDYYNQHSIGECEHGFSYDDAVALAFRDGAWTPIARISSDYHTTDGCCDSLVEWSDFVSGRYDCVEIHHYSEREAAGCDCSCEHSERRPEVPERRTVVEIVHGADGIPALVEIGRFQQIRHELNDQGFFEATAPEIACPADATVVIEGLAQRCVDADGASHGPTLVSFESGARDEWSEYEHGTRVGMRYRWYENGNRRLRGGYAAGAHGVWHVFTEDGTERKSETFVNGERHGPAWFVEEGVRYEGFYRNGLQDGPWSARPADDRRAEATETCYQAGTEIDCDGLVQVAQTAPTVSEIGLWSPPPGWVSAIVAPLAADRWYSAASTWFVVAEQPYLLVAQAWFPGPTLSSAVLPVDHAYFEPDGEPGFELETSPLPPEMSAAWRPAPTALFFTPDQCQGSLGEPVVVSAGGMTLAIALPIEGCELVTDSAAQVALLGTDETRLGGLTWRLVDHNTLEVTADVTSEQSAWFEQARTSIPFFDQDLTEQRTSAWTWSGSVARFDSVHATTFVALGEEHFNPAVHPCDHERLAYYRMGFVRDGILELIEPSPSDESAYPGESGETIFRGVIQTSDGVPPTYLASNGMYVELYAIDGVRVRIPQLWIHAFIGFPFAERTPPARADFCDRS